ncbi:DNA polymerase III subunit gamma and tau [Nonomuraea sp. SBT364]|uniref:DNA polymerase III subunit gamma and tau n=1 Tax=Nonomuraea sp. SBT364 TaxID=1580530 RepID=UPI00066AA735|nr:DNA polymerase III subunit gamma and tau [Nonomuraea sp. SBT364]
MSLALYRKYRPGTFAEVKGQEHVTDPLRQALRTGRVNHAYLFSGPRGCGKTSSARILARSLNCEKGPTPDPCGTCESCVALAPTGPGHLDVIEIDAASHGGVDDARDLRERAFFAPVSARFKIYIIDEAHMVTREGFNALLKLVEEPPPHLKFIFATTEPEKVIGTIKSRTHHYPFRLMPPATLRALMEEILSSESVPFEPTALPLVVRAGAGSARDSLSILDQLLAGAEDDGITYAKAVSLLGYTDGDLLDDVVAAFADRDGGRVFQAVNRVVEGGHDPRRFASDLLERFRDLVILANVPEAASSGLLDRPADELERLVQQAASMGPAELTRAAEIFNAGLTEMRGATSPRLLLELMCARVLLPVASQGEVALLARLERLERGGAVAQMAARSAAPAAPVREPVHDAAPGVAAHGPAAVVQGGGPAGAGHAAPDGGAAPGAAPGEGHAARPSADDWPETVRPGSPPQPAPVQPATAGQPAPGQSTPGSSPGSTPGSSSGQSSSGQGGPVAGGAGAIQQQWPAVLAALKQRSIVVWANVSTNAQVVGVEGNLVTLGFTQVGAMKNFTGGGKDAVVAGALGDVLGGTWRVEAVVGGGPPAASRGPQPGGSHPGGAPGNAPGSHPGGASGSHPGGAPGSHPGGASGSHPGGPSGPQGATSNGAADVQQAGPGSSGAAQGEAGGPAARGGLSGPPSGPAGARPEGAAGSRPGGPAGSHAGASMSSYGDAAARSGSGAAADGPQDAGSVQQDAAPDGTAGGPRTTDESWPSAPDDPGPGSPPTPDPTRTASGRASGGASGGAVGAGLAAARSAARAAAQAGPRAGARSGARQGATSGWPEAVPGRGKTSETEDVDPLNDADADVDAVSGMALLQRELGAQVIGEIDHT